MSFTLEDKIKCEDPYYSTDNYMDTAIKSLAEAREKIHTAMVAMDGADDMTHDGRAEAMKNMLKGLETFTRALEEQLEITADGVLGLLMDMGKETHGAIDEMMKETRARSAWPGKKEASE